MRQVLFHIPGLGLPVFGFGLMLCLTIFACPWLAARIVVREGKPREWVDALALWLFGFGFVGARIFYMAQYRADFDKPLLQFFQIWTGGLVVYGGLIGGVVGLLLFCWKNGIHPLWMLDVISPSMALGLCIGRIGCLLNGCCYGDYCMDRLGITFPSGGAHPSPPFVRMVSRGHQSPLGIVPVPEDRRILAVEPESDAARAGLRVGDEIVAIRGRPVPSRSAFNDEWRRLTEDDTGDFRIPEGPIELTIRRVDVEHPKGRERTIAFFPPRSLPIQPTQLFSSVDGLILCLFTLAWLPHRRRHGEVFGLLAICYAVTRFLIEYLRYDELPFGNGLTISQNGSVVLFAAGAGLLAFSRFSTCCVRESPVESVPPTIPAGAG